MVVINNNPFPVLNTERFVLRRITLDDAPSIFKLRSNINAMRYISRPIALTIDDAIALINKIDTMVTANEGVGWGVTFKNSNEVIASIGFHRIEKENFRAEVGYMLLPELWRQGITSEAIKCIINYGFNTLNFNSIEANISPDNEASKALVHSLGFRKEAYFRENLFHNGKFEDSEIYCLLRSDKANYRR